MLKAIAEMEKHLLERMEALEAKAGVGPQTRNGSETLPELRQEILKLDERVNAFSAVFQELKNMPKTHADGAEGRGGKLGLSAAGGSLRRRLDAVEIRQDNCERNLGKLAQLQESSAISARYLALTAVELPEAQRQESLLALEETSKEWQRRIAEREATTAAGGRAGPIVAPDVRTPGLDCSEPNTWPHTPLL